MDEKQNIEWKQSWRDEYLEWICGFANAHGGEIFIGKDDAGDVVGVKNAKKLMEDIPSKIRQQLGLVCDVNLHEKNRHKFIEVSVAPSSVPVSYRGHYYYRTGSTKTELTGSSLNEFLLKKAGKTWDLVIEESADLTDLDPEALTQFAKDAAAAGRVPDVEHIPHDELLQKLRVVDDDKITRAALVLFGKDPGRYFPNLVVKIGRFGVDDADLRFQETAEGNLIQVLTEVIEVLQHKFLVKPVRFEGIRRIEEWEYPTAALREILLNSLVHRNYMGAMTQIRVYDDKLTAWNAGTLPPEIPVQQLKTAHPSIPRNPLIADVCYKAGYIDTWGRGIQKILSACREFGLVEPEFEDAFGGLLVTLWSRQPKSQPESQPKSQPESQPELQPESQPESRPESDEVLEPGSLAMRVMRCLVSGPLSKSEISKKLGQKAVSGQLNQVVRRLVDTGHIAMTSPEKPNSRRQKYRVTDKGRLLLD